MVSKWIPKISEHVSQIQTRNRYSGVIRLDIETRLEEKVALLQRMV